MATFSPAEVENLTAMLDKNFGFTRPASQTVGYSLAEDSASTNRVTASSTGNGSGEQQQQQQQVAPGGVHIPATVVNKTLGLPAPSLSKEAQAIQRAQLATEKAPRPKGNAIWADEEVAKIGSQGAPAKTTVAAKGSNGTACAASAGKVEPEHEVLYKQNVSAEDVYLGADFTRDGSSALSDGIVVKIKLPKAESAKDFVLDVQPFALLLTTNDYYLKAHLPARVVEKKASAKWDVSKKMLVVTLCADTSDKEVKMVA